MTLFQRKVHREKTMSKQRNRIESTWPILYRNNSSSAKIVILSGDTESNPGPIFKTTNGRNTVSKQKEIYRNPICEVCSETVRRNSKHLLCEYCKNLFRFK